MLTGLKFVELILNLLFLIRIKMLELLEILRL